MDNIILSSDNDIINFAIVASRDLFKKNLSFIRIRSNFISNPFLFIEKGFLPSFEKEDYDFKKYFDLKLDPKFLLESYVKGLTEGEFIFWYGSSFDKLLDLKYHPIWIYGTIEYWKELAIKTIYSLPLLIYAPEYLYKESKRPKTDMLMFRLSGFNNNLLEKDTKLLPVTRYAQGMSQGLYYKNIDSDLQAGTYYYHEPESRTFLKYKTMLTFKNKYQAFRTLFTLNDFNYYQYLYQLLIELKDNKFNEFLLSSSNKKKDIINKKTFDFLQFYFGFFKNFIDDEDFLAVNSSLPNDLMMTPLEAYLYFPNIFKHRILDQVKLLPQNKFYIERLLKLYAIEDSFDDILYLLGKRANVDIIILQSMVGSHQIVTEILDIRDRLTSFQNLVFNS